MKPEDKTSLTPHTSQDSPDAFETQECPESKSPEPQPEGDETETQDVAETQQCPDCSLLHPDEEPDLELYCACSPPGTKNGIPMAPEQVLTQYNSRPPRMNINPVRPAYAAPVPANPSPGRPIYAVPIQTNPARPAYTTPNRR